MQKQTPQNKTNKNQKNFDYFCLKTKKNKKCTHTKKETSKPTQNLCLFNCIHNCVIILKIFCFCVFVFVHEGMCVRVRVRVCVCVFVDAFCICLSFFLFFFWCLFDFLILEIWFEVFFVFFFNYLSLKFIVHSHVLRLAFTLYFSLSLFFFFFFDWHDIHINYKPLSMSDCIRINIGWYNNLNCCGFHSSKN